MIAPEPLGPSIGEEIAFQVAQIAEAGRRGHPSPAALARFHARARANLTAQTRRLPPEPFNPDEGSPPMARKTKTLGVNLPVPQSREEAANAVKEIGDVNREAARIEADMNDRLAALKQEGEEAARPLKERIVALTEGVKVWCEANRDALTGGGKTKTADLGTGKVMWRLRPPSVRVTGVDRVIEAIKALGFASFLRTKEEVNKEALLADPVKARMIAGVSIGTAGEDFVVEPFEAEISGGR